MFLDPFGGNGYSIANSCKFYQILKIEKCIDYRIVISFGKTSGLAYGKIFAYYTDCGCLRLGRATYDTSSTRLSLDGSPLKVPLLPSSSLCGPQHSRFPEERGASGVRVCLLQDSLVQEIELWLPPFGPGRANLSEARALHEPSRK